MERIREINADILQMFPPAPTEAADILLSQELKKNSAKIVVLDDDPTGVQTVHHVSVYTHWDKESIRSGFAEAGRLFYILTNSRGMTAAQTEVIHRQIGESVSQVAKEQNRDFLIISRSDSTLRGHYPLETETLRQAIESGTGKEIDGEVICPFFKEGGRFTIGGVHYVKYGSRLVPAGETEFARDKTFGYRSSKLGDYVEEKTQGRFTAGEVIDIALEDLRAMDLDKIEKQLLSVSGFQKIIVNAADYADIKVFCTALYRAMAKGKYFLFRSAAALVKEMGGIPDKPLLTRAEMIVKENPCGGVVIVGSHTRKTTEQLEELRKVPGLKFVEFNSDLVLDEKKFAQETDRVIREMESAVSGGQTVVVYTRRRLLTVENDTKESALLRSIRISQGVQSLVASLRAEPSFIIAKGGITSSDIGTKALNVRCAQVMGQIRPGIPVWQTGEESRFPSMPYVIFPGNVGEKETLREALEVLIGYR